MTDDKKTRELVEYAVGADIAGTPSGEWSTALTEPMAKMTTSERAAYLANLTFNAINSLSAIVQRAAAENGMDPMLYWASHVKLTNELSGD
jgi:hypothetical protein